MAAAGPTTISAGVNASNRTPSNPIYDAWQKYRNCVWLDRGHPWSDRMDAALRRLGEMLREGIA